MNVYRAYVVSNVAVRWFAPVVGVPLIEGRIGEDRVFGSPLSNGQFLLWATESMVFKAIKNSPKGATAKLAHEARAEGVDIPKSLASLSGCSSEQGVWSSTKVEQSASDAVPKLSDDRTVGLTSDGLGAAPIEIKAKKKGSETDVKP